MEYFQNFTLILRDLIDETGISVCDFSKAADLHSPRVYGFLSGRYTPSLKSAIKIADYFHCPLDYLFGIYQSYAPHVYTITATVTQRVRAAIDQSPLSRYQISRKTGITQSNLCQWYHGEKIPALRGLLTLAETLQCPLDYLAGRDE